MIRVLDFHNTLTLRVERTVRRRKEGKKEKKKKKRKNPILGRTDSLGRWISLAASNNKKFPLRYTHFPPPRSTRFQRSGSSGQFFDSTEPMTKRHDHEQRAKSSRNSPLSATRSLARCSHGRARRKEARERNETKRSADRTQLAGAAGPRMPCGPAGSGTLARVGRIKRQA